ncbi:toll/interleukin-1 receptor domain-containing protein [Microbacterium stercoris]|uniref:TIR domain-containing protein n=1 Tax=Microbacterium stercoris TaxID=2820289 RepID=A0A939QJI8_9MICO|nr:TIR domain-containing protein [Microbacterium stercoris]MBO3664072.1 TIR domain-containing protein [Microbacterium stercoris]
MAETEYDFDVAVTFAGEDRSYVEEVVKLVKAQGFAVFYDEDSKVATWGEDLTEYFADVYERRARYAVMFISASYAAKPWTRLERRSVLARALQEASPYLLPVRLDSTQLSGVRSTIGYLDGHEEGSAGIADAIREKLQQPKSDGERRFNGRVPRTPAEVAILLGERPRAWEYLLFAYWLVFKLEQNKSAYNDHRLKFAISGQHIDSEEVLDYSQAELARLGATTATFEELLSGDAQATAMGLPGEPGDPDLIEHLADRMIAIYVDLMGWAYRLRSAAPAGDEAREMLRALADYATQPIEEIRRFVYGFRDEMDEITARLAEGNVERSEYITFVIPDDVRERYDRALQAQGPPPLGERGCGRVF